MSEPPRPERLCAVITTYQPDAGFVDRVNRIVHQVGLVVIVDDGPSAEGARGFREWFGEQAGVLVVHHPVNRGVAAALNTGVRVGLDRGFDWILTLDDDSVVATDMVRQLVDHFKRVSKSPPIGLMAMSFCPIGADGPVAIEPTLTPAYVDKRHIITSGALFHASTFEAVGPFREEFFIDWVDYDYCLRARAKGYRVVKTTDVGFAHCVGEPSVGRLFGIQVRVVRHSSKRVYYWFRNSLVLAIEHVRTDPLLASAIVIAQLKMIWSLTCFGPERRTQLRSAFRGIVDGGLRRLGER